MKGPKHANHVSVGDRVCRTDGPPDRHGTVERIYGSRLTSNGGVAMATVRWDPPPAHPNWPASTGRVTITRLTRIPTTET